MTPEELKKEALKAKEHGGFVVLRIPKGKFPRSFPRGTLLSEEVVEGKVMRVYGFDPDKILLWLEKNLKEV